MVIPSCNYDFLIHALNKWALKEGAIHILPTRILVYGATVNFKANLLRRF